MNYRQWDSAEMEMIVSVSGFRRAAMENCLEQIATSNIVSPGPFHPFMFRESRPFGFGPTEFTLRGSERLITIIHDHFVLKKSIYILSVGEVKKTD